MTPLSTVRVPPKETIPSTAGTGVDTFETTGDLRGSTFTGVENLVGDHISGSVEQFNSFKSITNHTTSEHLLLKDGGALNLSTKVSSDVDVTASDAGNKITSGHGNDHLHGGAGGDTLSGGDGNDTEDGGGGTDVLSGGGGSDDLHGGDGGDTLSGGTGDDNLHGDAGDDSLAGGDGNDVLDGGTGADKLAGGGGNDTYVVDNTGDKVGEKDGGGTDTVDASVSYKLGSFVENLQLTGHDDLSATGNALDNFISGNDGNNIINGGGGHDTLTGGAGADTFVFGKGGGLDTINDFSAASGDTLNLHAFHAHETAVISQDGTSTHVDLGGGNIVTLLNTESHDAAFLSHIVW